MAIEFDNRLEKQLKNTTHFSCEIIIHPIRFEHLVEILNFPSHLGFETSYYKNLEVFTFNRNGNSDRYSFEECPKLKTIYLPDSATILRDCCFYNCSSLVSIEIPNSVTKIGHFAFAFCTNLTNITISNSVTCIDNWAFDNCSSLQNINIPNSVTRIGDSAFEYCSSLKNINISNSVTRIEQYAFYGCSNLQSIDIPNSVKEFGVGIFKSSSHADGFKINFHSQETMNLFLKTNPGDAKYCQLLPN